MQQLEQLKNTRSEYLLQLQNEATNLEKALQNREKEIDTKKFIDLFENIRQTNKSIKKQDNNEDVKSRKKFKFSNGTLIFIGVQLINALAITGLSIYIFKSESTNKDHNCRKENGPLIAQLVCAITQPIIGLVIGEAVREGNNDKKDLENKQKSLEILGNLSELKDFGAKAAIKFLSVLEEFQQEIKHSNEKMENIKQESLETKKLLARCIRKLQKIPKKPIKEGIFPDNKLWLSHLVNSYAETDKELKEKILQLEHDEDSQDSSRKYSGNDKEIFIEFNDSKINLYSEDESSDEKGIHQSFNGEKCAFKEIKLDSFSTSTPKTNDLPPSTKNKKTWSEIENHLNLDIKMLITDKGTFHKQQTATKRKKTSDILIDL